MYRIVFSNDAKKDLKELNKKAPQAVKKLSKLLEEIQEHPRYVYILEILRIGKKNVYCSHE